MGELHFDEAGALEAATRAYCTLLVKQPLGLTWDAMTAARLALAVSGKAPSVLDRLADLIREIRELADRGKWPHLGDEIVFRVRAPSPPDPLAVGSGFAGPTGPIDPQDAEQRLLHQGLAAVAAAPLRIVVDEEPGEGPLTLRIHLNPKGLPRTDVQRKNLAALLGDAHTHKHIAAASVLMQPAAYFRDALKEGHARPVDVLEKECRAIKAECHALGIVRGKRGRPKKIEGR